MTQDEQGQRLDTEERLLREDLERAYWKLQVALERNRAWLASKTPAATPPSLIGVAAHHVELAQTALAHFRDWRKRFFA